MIDVLLWLLLTIFDIIRGTIIISIPLFILTFFGLTLFDYLSKKVKTWFWRTIISTYIELLLLILLLYIGFYLLGISNYSVGIVPAQIAPSAIEFLWSNLLFSFVVFVKRIFAAAILTLLITPFFFIGSFIFEAIHEKNKKMSFHLKLYFSILFCALISYILIILMPWIPMGIIGFIFLF